jgi:hypothetical protein
VADINVERRNPSIWPWIIGLVVLALLIWAVAELLSGDGGAEQGTRGEEVGWIAPAKAPVVPARVA